MTALRHLLEALRQGARPPLSVDDVEVLLSWLTGSAARDGASGADLPHPGHDPVLLQMVLHRLDDVLFDGGELKPAAAGLDPEEPATRRRIRFRRLASAFHPDRFPDLADWLTQRSQAVHRAYARFKQDPDAPAMAPTPRPYPPPPAGRNVRPAAPRVRKHRFRAFANQLRARFGNDRYLAHKLIGGLALLALLPVLNMVLVPSPKPEDTAGSVVSSSDSADGLRLTVDAGEEDEKPVSGFRVPVSGGGQDTERNADESEGDGSPINSEESLAGPAPTRVEGSVPSVDSDSASEPSTGVGAGPAGDEGGRESRMAAAPSDAAEPDLRARKPETGNPKAASSISEADVSPLLAAARLAMNPNGGNATVAALQTVDEQLAAMGLEDDTERLYRRIGEEKNGPVNGERFTVDAGDEGKPGSGGGEEDTGGRKDREASLAGQAPTPADGSDAAKGSDTVSGLSTGVGAGLAGDENPDAGQISAGAGSGRDQSATEPPPTESTTNHQQLAATQPSTSVGAGLAGDEEGPETRSLARQAPTPVADPEAASESVAAGSSSDNSELVLGPLGRHPAGEVLQRFHAAMQAGNIAGIAGSFAPDARMDSLRGRDEIADHFRSALSRADSRQVNLKVLRLGREDGGWRVEADLDVRVVRSENRKNLLAGRSSFLLTGRGDRLLIARMDLE